MPRPIVDADLNDITNVLYRVLCPVLEGVEHKTRHIGNGHHATQEVLEAFEAELKRLGYVKEPAL